MTETIFRQQNLYVLKRRMFWPI